MHKRRRVILLWKWNAKLYFKVICFGCKIRCETVVHELAVQRKIYTPFSKSIQNVINENEYEFQFYAEFSPNNNKYRALISWNWEHRTNSILWRNLLYSPLHWTWIEFKQIFPFEGGIMTDSLRKSLNSRVLSLLWCVVVCLVFCILSFVRAALKIQFHSLYGS